MVGWSTNGGDGWVEVYRFGQWGKLCVSDWSLDDAIVVCRQLGFKSASAASCSYCDPDYSDTANFWTGDVLCDGDEHSLDDCSVSWSTNYPSTSCYNEHASLECADEPLPTLEPLPTGHSIATTSFNPLPTIGFTVGLPLALAAVLPVLIWLLVSCINRRRRGSNSQLTGSRQWRSCYQDSGNSIQQLLPPYEQPPPYEPQTGLPRLSEETAEVGNENSIADSASSSAQQVQLT